MRPTLSRCLARACYYGRAFPAERPILKGGEVVGSSAPTALPRARAAEDPSQKGRAVRRVCAGLSSIEASCLQTAHVRANSGIEPKCLPVPTFRVYFRSPIARLELPMLVST